jgi:hypothetical protein
MHFYNFFVIIKKPVFKIPSPLLIWLAAKGMLIISITGLELGKNLLLSNIKAYKNKDPILINRYLLWEIA